MYITFKGILYSLKKFALLVLAVAIAFGAFGAGIAFSKAEESDETGEIVLSEDHIATRTYMISLPDGASEADTIEAEIATAKAVAALLDKDSSRAYVLQLLAELYSGAEGDEPSDAPTTQEGETEKNEEASPTLPERFGRAPDAKLDHNALNGYLSTDVSEGTSMITLSVTSKNKDFSQEILACYGEYLCGPAIEYMGAGATCAPLGETTLNTRISGGMQSISPEGSVYVAMVKYAIIFAAVGAVASCCLVAMVEFFNPTMVYEEDFLRHEVKLYGESCTARREKTKFAKDALLREIMQKKYGRVVVAGTLKGERAARQRAEIARSLAQNSDAEVISVDAALEEFAQFEKIKQANAVILVERKGTTTNARFKKLVSLIREYDIEILGGVSL